MGREPAKGLFFLGELGRHMGALLADGFGAFAEFLSQVVLAFTS